MNTILLVLLGGAMLAVLATLFIGLFTMARGGDGTGIKQNKLMQMRVGFQALALVLFVLALINSQA
ncbi:MAG: twin transmembrane helix small protein [Elstera sp.]